MVTTNKSSSWDPHNDYRRYHSCKTAAPFPTFESNPLNTVVTLFNLFDNVTLSPDHVTVTWGGITFSPDDSVLWTLREQEAYWSTLIRWLHLPLPTHCSVQFPQYPATHVLPFLDSSPTWPESPLIVLLPHAPPN
jgi:hypothetical protein